MGSFSHDNARFSLEHIEGLKLENRVPAGEDGFLDRVAAASAYISKLSPRERVSWFIARLNYLTAGQVQRTFSDAGGDDGGFILSLVVLEATKRPSGIFLINVFPDRLQLRGGRDNEARDPRELFLQALVSEPDWIEKCRIRVRNAETRTVWYCGWDSGQFILG